MSNSDSQLLTAQNDSSPTLIIEGLTDQLAILRYFETINAGDFEATGLLFASEGAMYPPFESPVVGPTAISTFLQAEAQGMQLQPKQGLVESLADDQTQVRVSGKVQTALFGVNVSWQFVLNAEGLIVSAVVKLLASPEQLLQLKG
ncbi:ketosteroid isomerase family protein [Leptolyngbya sp. FACHB-261]|uniref:ketosteroid isomerase family protein n=1 Tax=Leptolyngbya sp. FACHB-261 TaxID=2692806 RepID=UPI0016835B41|nr:ketosteroid isomerase family protein [Leptolyngbya sp. FACHB-261]MBD2100644.1 nuclear transport factor 2 family protein [Leptolyngbya sp. FACHB-261]